MKILAIDTSGDTCSAALLCGGELTQALELAPRRHGELILDMMARLLGHAGLTLGALDALAFGRGPGSFTGVRIATAVVQGAAFGAGLGVVGVSTLAALAQGHLREDGHGRVLSALDARMGEVYWGSYEASEAGLMELRGDESVVRPQSIPRPVGGGWHGVGSGFAAYPVELGEALGTELVAAYPRRFCEARDIAVLAQRACRDGLAVAPELALPVYLRDRVTADG
jgi:tRNA threonylcarbamoyladenosine biosynthesis protein TsaB